MDRHDFTIIEGAGGLMAPLAGGMLMADLARELKLPLLVVTRPNLGTINHTLLTLFTARAMELPVAGYLINRMPAEQGVAEETAPHSLASLTTEDLLGVLNQVAGDDREKSKILAAELAALPTLPLLTPYLP
jgi:dethiobiotin synthetase